jgi:hypothetical protein
MKWNIKLDAENWTGGLNTRHSLLTRMCFNFFSQHSKILKFYCQPTLNTVAGPAMPTPGTEFEKEYNFTIALFYNNFD